jgi:hypothetical protein
LDGNVSIIVANCRKRREDRSVISVALISHNPCIHPTQSVLHLPLLSHPSHSSEMLEHTYYPVWCKNSEGYDLNNTLKGSLILVFIAVHDVSHKTYQLFSLCAVIITVVILLSKPLLIGVNRY